MISGLVVVYIMEQVARSRPPRPATPARYATGSPDALVEFTKSNRTVPADSIEHLDLDIVVSPKGILTITETMIVPPQLTPLPGEYGFSRVLSNAPRDILRGVPPPTRGFKLDILQASCDGEAIPYYLHEYQRRTRICLDPPKDSSLTKSRVYSVTYTTTSDVYYPFWSQYRCFIFTALFNEYDRPVERVDVHIEFPDDAVIERDQVVGWTGTGHQYGLFDWSEYSGNSENFEVTTTASNVVELNNAAPIQADGNLMFRVYVPRSAISSPIRFSIIGDIFTGIAWVVIWAYGIFLAVGIPLGVIYDFFKSPEEREKARAEKGAAE